MRYSNPYCNEKNHASKPFYNTDGFTLTEYKGHQISKRSDIEYHVIFNEVCIGMYAGINGSKYFIDNL